MYHFVDDVNAFNWQLKFYWQNKIYSRRLHPHTSRKLIILWIWILVRIITMYLLTSTHQLLLTSLLTFTHPHPTHTVLFRFWCKFLFFRWSFILNLDMLCSVINCQLGTVWDFPAVFSLYHLCPSSRQLVSSESPVQCHEWNILWVLRRSLCRNFAYQWRESCFSQARYE